MKDNTITVLVNQNKAILKFPKCNLKSQRL